MPDSGYEVFHLLCQARLRAPALCSSLCWGLAGYSDVFPFHLPWHPIHSVAMRRWIALCKLLGGSWLQMQLGVTASIVDHSAAEQKQHPLQIMTVLMVIYQIILHILNYFIYMFIYQYMLLVPHKTLQAGKVCTIESSNIPRKAILLYQKRLFKSHT